MALDRRAIVALRVVGGLGCLLRTSPIPALDFTAGSGAAAECDDFAPEVHAAAASYLEPAPVLSLAEYGGARYQPSPGNNLGLGTGFVEASMETGPVCVGLLYRAEFFATGTRDVLDVIVGNHFDRPFDVGRTYDLRYQLHTLQASGARLRHVFEFDPVPAWRMRLGVGASLLDALQGRSESLTGSATATAPEYAVGSATWLRTDSDLNPASLNPFIGPGHPHGSGFSTDLHFQAIGNSGTRVEFIVMDVVGRIYWRDDFNSLRTADNATVRYDANFDREALIEGRDGHVDFTQNLQRKYRLAAEQALNRTFTLLLSDDCVDGYHFPSLGARMGSTRRYVETDFDIRTHALSLGTRWSGLEIALTSNSWRPDHANALGISLGFQSGPAKENSK